LKVGRLKVGRLRNSKIADWKGEVKGLKGEDGRRVFEYVEGYVRRDAALMNRSSHEPNSMSLWVLSELVRIRRAAPFLPLLHSPTP
jgi:hypothetical protein